MNLIDCHPGKSDLTLYYDLSNLPNDSGRQFSVARGQM